MARRPEKGSTAVAHQVTLEAEIEQVGSTEDGWAINERTGRARMKCACGTDTDMVDMDSAMSIARVHSPALARLLDNTDSFVNTPADTPAE
jgi:hypothetical protein